MKLRSIILTIVIVVCLLFTGEAQTNSISGIVVDSNDLPIAEVSVRGKLTQTCCPVQVQVERTTTDAQGKFALKDPTPLVHLWKETFGEQVVVLTQGVSDVRVRMEDPSKTALRIPDCNKVKRLGKTIRESSLKFWIPNHSAALQQGKWDVDYVKHFVTSRSSGTRLTMVFGPTAADSMPSDERFL